MPFQADRRLAEEAGRVFGEYLTTFTSRGGQVRADLFRKGISNVAQYTLTK